MASWNSFTVNNLKSSSIFSFLILNADNFANGDRRPVDVNIRTESSKLDQHKVCYLPPAENKSSMLQTISE